MNHILAALFRLSFIEFSIQVYCYYWEAHGINHILAATFRFTVVGKLIYYNPLVDHESEAWIDHHGVCEGFGWTILSKR